MSLADAGEMFISDLIRSRHRPAILRENEGSDVKDQLDKDGGKILTQTAHEVRDMDIYGLPEPRPSDEQPSESIHLGAENKPQIPLPPSKIAVPHDVGGNDDAPP